MKIAILTMLTSGIFARSKVSFEPFDSSMSDDFVSI
jgi:hypothetical protein